jgi:hypothetical protein
VDVIWGPRAVWIQVPLESAMARVPTFEAREYVVPECIS